MLGIKVTKKMTSEVLSSLLLDLGSHVRYLDENADYNELWALDGDYMIEERWRSIDACANSANPEVIGTVTLRGVVSLIDDMLRVISVLEKEE